MGKSSKGKKALKSSNMPFAVVSLLDQDTAVIEGAKRDADLIDVLSEALFNDDYLGIMVFEQKLSASGRNIYDLEFVLAQHDPIDPMNIIRLAMFLDAQKVTSHLIKVGAKARKTEALAALEEVKMTINLPDYNPDKLEICQEMYEVITTPKDLNEAYYYLECAANSEDYPSVRMAAAISAKYISECERKEISSAARAPGLVASVKADAMRM